MCLAQGPQRSDAGEARTRGPSVSSQALYHWATALPQSTSNDQLKPFLTACLVNMSIDRLFANLAFEGYEFEIGKVRDISLILSVQQ